MFGLRSDLPLDRDAAAKFLPWIIGFMVYLAALAVGTAMVVDRLSANWQSGLTGNLTVEAGTTVELASGRTFVARLPSRETHRAGDPIDLTPDTAGIHLFEEGAMGANLIHRARMPEPVAV